MNARAAGSTFAIDQVLVRREPEIAAMHLRDLAQPGELRASSRVGDAARLDAQRQVPAAVVTLDPAEAIAVRRELERPRRLEREAQPARDLGDEPVEAAIGRSCT